MSYSLRYVALATNLNRTSATWNSYRAMNRSRIPTFESNRLLLNSSRIFAQEFKTNLRLMPTGVKLTAGNMIEFRSGDQLVLGVVQGQRQDKWLVYDQSGTVKPVRGQDISLVLPGDDYTHHDVSVFLENASNVDRSLVEISWQIMDIMNQPLTLTDMAESLLGNTSPVGLYMAYALLKQDRKFFKQISRDPPLYFRRTPAEVQNQVLSEQKVQTQKQNHDNFKSSVARALEKSYKDRPLALHWLEGEYKDRIQALKEFALAEGPVVKSRNLAMESLRICGLSVSPNSALRLLEAMRVLTKHEPIALKRAGIQAEFSTEVLTAAQELIANESVDIDGEKRQDLTHLYAISIDDEGTREIDDALSVEPQIPGDKTIRVWVHVSDPSRWLELSSVVDMEAQKRSTSLYIPTGVVPVYPWELIDEKFSLTAGEKRYALSFRADIDPTGEIRSYNIVPSFVRPEANYTYTEVDEALNQKSNADLQRLLTAAQRRNKRRKLKGAVDISLPNCKIKVKFDDEKEEPELKIMALSEKTPAREMVSEFMILAGEIAGRYGALHGVPLPYRSQAAPVLPKLDEIVKVPEGPCRNVMLRGRMMRGVTSATPAGRHSGLGADSYVQATSPIRRYPDFLAHVQLKSHLRGEDRTPFDAVNMKTLLANIMDTSRRRMNAETEVFNYWVAEYFRRHQESHVWTATMLAWQRQEQGQATVLIDEIGLERKIKIDKECKPGNKLTIGVGAVDVKSGFVRFEEVQSKSKRLVMDA